MTQSILDIEDLKSHTRKFFRLHWTNEIATMCPEWEYWNTFLYGSVPKYNEGGCYALFVNDELVYVGLGASKGGGLYFKSGISRRLMSHVYCSAKSGNPKELKLKEPWFERGVTGLYTIGLSDKDYLAPALESYLIRELSPRYNNRV
jgi:hypothetical protein